MNKSTVTLCALPGETTLGFGDQTLEELISSARRLELRIEKGANQEDDRRRYHLLCNLIEQEAARKLAEGDEILSLELASSAHDLLAELEENLAQEELPKRFGTSFFLAEDLESFTNSLSKAAKKLDGKVQVPEKELEFYERAQEKGLCVVVLQRVGNLSKSDQELVISETEYEEVSETSQEEPTDYSGMSYQEVITRQLKSAVEKTIRGEAGSVNFSNHSNDVIAKVLRDFVYFQSDRYEPTLIKVVYSDGSEARPFPLFCLQQRSDEELAKLREQFRELKVGLVSARHAREMDGEMDVYWFRNQEVSVTRRTAETDEICYQKSKQLLEDMREEGSYRLGLYQTGFEPAVIGFYRALVEELMLRADEEPSLEVTSYYYRGNNTYERGARWN